MSGLQVGPIKDFALGIYDGPHATPKEAGEGPIFLGIKNVTPQGTLDFSEIRHVSEQEYPKWTKRVVPRENDIVFSYEATLHRYALIPEGFKGCLGRRMALVRPDPAKVHPRFLHYYFLTAAWRAIVESNIISGATVDRVPLTKFPGFEVQLPALDLQRRIAFILSAYDDLIENNRRRIQLLEQAARLLYKEWFVHLRFPGHEHVKIKDGVPEGWDEGCVGNLASVKSGFAFKSKDWQQEGNPVVKIKNISGNGTVDTINCDCVSGSVAEKAASFAIPIGSLIIAMTGATVGKVGIMPDGSRTCYLNQRVGLFVSKSGDPVERYLFPFFQEVFAQIQVINLAGGAAQPNISGGQIESIQLLIPNNKIFDLYLESTRAIFQQRQTLLEQNEKLTQARDLLLPRLMNGEVAA